MQETPNFESYKNQFNQYTLTDLIDSREKVQEPYRSLIENTHLKVSEYFTDNEFRSTLGQSRKTSIEGQIANILSQFGSLQSWQVSGTTIAGGNIQNLQNNISSYLDEFDLRFTQPHQLYRLQNGQDINKIIREISTLKDEAESDKNDTKKILTEAGLVIAEAESQKLANYYQYLANGREITENVKLLKEIKKQISIKKAMYYTFPSMLLLCLVIDKMIEIARNQSINIDLLFIILGPLIFSAIILLIAIFLNWLNKKYPGGYARSSFMWMIGTIASTTATAIYAAVLVSNFGLNAGWEQIVPKIIGLLAPAYFVRFCVQNYKANMHLTVQNTHRATLAQVTNNFSKLISNKNPAFEQDVLKGRIDIIKTASQVMFAQSESGYLTTKEGAGNEDNILDGLSKLRR